jgi:hypothetical protein
MSDMKIVFECVSYRAEATAPILADAMADALQKVATILPASFQKEAQDLVDLFKNAEIRRVEPKRASNIIIIQQ